LIKQRVISPITDPEFLLFDFHIIECSLVLSGIPVMFTQCCSEVMITREILPGAEIEILMRIGPEN
jgi:hypothetical protein